MKSERHNDFVLVRGTPLAQHDSLNTRFSQETTPIESSARTSLDHVLLNSAKKGLDLSLEIIDTHRASDEVFVFRYVGIPFTKVARPEVSNEIYKHVK